MSHSGIMKKSWSLAAILEKNVAVKPWWQLEILHFYQRWKDGWMYGWMVDGGRQDRSCILFLMKDQRLDRCKYSLKEPIATPSVVLKKSIFLHHFLHSLIKILLEIKNVKWWINESHINKSQQFNIYNNTKCDLCQNVSENVMEDFHMSKRSIKKQPFLFVLSV